MFLNYLKIALRNIYREKGYALINIAGLSVGIASCILILMFIINELSYDSHHKNSDRIFRAGIEAVFGDSHFYSALTSAAMKDALEYEFSDIEEATRLIYVTRPVVKYGDQSFIEDKFFYADSNFFKVFTVPLVKGNEVTALSRPNTMVISEEAASKYFGDQDPTGKVLKINDQYDIEITGVYEDMPHNSHFRCDFLGSIETVRNEYQDYWEYWTSNNLYTYFLLRENTGHDEFEDRMQDLVYKYVAPEVEQHMGINIEAFESSGGLYRFFAEPLQDIHLDSTADNQLNPGGNRSYIFFFSIIAGFILLIGCINFMNMATARYANRAKEVGVRKVVGSSRGQLVQQFLTESVMISMVAIILAMTMVELLLPWFNNLTGKTLEITYFNNWYVLPSLVGFGIITGILAGSYPAFFLSSFKPVRVLKGKVNAGIKSNMFRKSLVVVQFSITISLLIGTLLITEQLEFWQSRDQGYDREGLMVIKRAHVLGDQQETFREELIKNQGIVNASFCSSLPGYDFSGTSFHKYGEPAEELVQTLVIWADEHYLETMGMELSEGRFFSKDYGTDDDAIVVNETLARVTGLTDISTDRIVFPHLNLTSPVTGIIKDANFESLHRNIRPVIIRKIDSPEWLLAIRVDRDNMPEVISTIEQTWNRFTEDAPFIYSFLENDLLKLYSQEMRTSRIFTIFSLLAIFIACLGLLGMASFSAEKRTKEIGVRKAMGASMFSIYNLLTREVIMLILLATVLAWPAAWFVMNHWLDNFSYRIDIGITTFIISTVIALVIALLTVSNQARKAAGANPVDSLKYE